MSDTASRGPRTERVFAVLNRDPLQAPHQLRTDLVVTGVVGVLGLLLAMAVPGDGNSLDAPGWAMFAAVTTSLVWRRRHPVPVLLVMVVLVGTYHALDYSHAATTPATMVALYTVAVTGPPMRAALLGVGTVATTLTVMFLLNTDRGLEMLRTSGWIIAVLVIGMDVRVYRKYIAAMVERAERAERTREEEAARRVAEERLRIARDLHDLLAHSITLIGVQTSVASHVLTVSPTGWTGPRSRRRSTASRTPAEVRAPNCAPRWRCCAPPERPRARRGPGAAPCPTCPRCPASWRARGRRARRHCSRYGRRAYAYRRSPRPPRTGSCRSRSPTPYGTPAPAPRVRVLVETRGGALHVTVTDNGGGPGGKGAPADPGYGIVGMRERARSVGGTLDAGPYDDGFRVAAVLPLREHGDQAADDPAGDPANGERTGGGRAVAGPAGPGGRRESVV